MRSLKRNSWPVDKNGMKIQYTNYGSFYPHLIKNFGVYCCYCECEIRKEDVEHVAPKSRNPQLVCDWNNLLLACPNCNRDYKKNINPTRQGYVWPDIDDTFDIFEYCVDGSMLVKSSINSPQKENAEQTIALMNLNPKNSRKDSICEIRKRKWLAAKDILDCYEKNGAPAIESIVNLAVSGGYWSVWMSVFKNHPEVTKKISDAFPGTLPKYCSP